MSALRWWAEKVGKENIIARSNFAYGIPDQVYVTNISKAKDLDMFAPTLGASGDAKANYLRVADECLQPADGTS